MPAARVVFHPDFVDCGILAELRDERARLVGVSNSKLWTWVFHMTNRSESVELHTSI
jgi:hypothetical protein